MRKLKSLLLSLTFLGAGIGYVHAEGPAGDAFGNFITSSKFDRSISTNLFHDISLTGTFLTQGDDAAALNVSLGGLVFPFYGINYTNLTFSTNGYVSTSPTIPSGDWTNPASLPTYIGAGARIFAYHDDTEATVFGQYFNQAASPIGSETYIAQWNACHYSCNPADPAQIDLRYNVMLLRDGTIIMAYDKVSSEAGGDATIGIQNDGATDGVAYLIDEPAMTNGMTIIVLAPTTAFRGLSDDVAIASSELGILQTRAQASLTTDAVRAAFAAGSDDNTQTDGTNWITVEALDTTTNIVYPVSISPKQSFPLAGGTAQSLGTNTGLVEGRRAGVIEFSPEGSDVRRH